MSRALEFTDTTLRFLAAPPPRARVQPLGAPARDAPAHRQPPARPLRRAPKKAHLARVGRGRGGMARGTHPLADVGGEDPDGAVRGTRGGGELNVICVDGVLYFEEHLDDARLREKNDIAPHHRQQTYFDCAFESYCTSTTPPSGGTPSINIPQAPGDPPG
ncbi:hypothetical protein B0H13DRAFT_1860135 [Mycena leptocephala]|nr:hypothetical protein B0H13DRAFT_1860135 [Mycena leptocephala]